MQGQQHIPASAAALVSISTLLCFSCSKEPNTEVSVTEVEEAMQLHPRDAGYIVLIIKKK